MSGYRETFGIDPPEELTDVFARLPAPRSDGFRRPNKADESSPAFYPFFAQERYPTPVQQERDTMGMLMIRCPKTGATIFTGRYVECDAFRAGPVFFSRTHCPHCCATHEWFAKDAWVCDSEFSECTTVSERQVT